MERKPRFFIFDRRERIVLFLLIAVGLLFSFTLGIHLGKKVGFRERAQAPSDLTPVETSDDKVPNRVELSEQMKGVNQAADESLNQALHDEVARTGIKLETPRQVELPKKPASPNAGATRLKADAAESKGEAEGQGKSEADVGAKPDSKPVTALHRDSPSGEFTIQVGSYPTLEEAKDHVEALETVGIQPVLRVVELVGKGKWYRIFVGGYASKDAAQKAGDHYVRQHVIESFIISKMP